MPRGRPAKIRVPGVVDEPQVPQDNQAEVGDNVVEAEGSVKVDEQIQTKADVPLGDVSGGDLVSASASEDAIDDVEKSGSRWVLHFDGWHLK